MGLAGGLPRRAASALFSRTTLYALVAIPAFILLDTAFPPRELLREVLPSFITQAVIPGGLLALIVVLPVLVLWRFKPGTTNAREESC